MWEGAQGGINIFTKVLGRIKTTGWVIDQGWRGGAGLQCLAIVYSLLSAWGLLEESNHAWERCLKFRYLIVFFYFYSDISVLERRPKLLLEL